MEIELRQIVDALPGLVWTAHPNGRGDFFNQRWREYSGLSAEQASGEGWQSTVHPDDRPALLAAWQRCINAGIPGEVEARMRRHDGVYRWFHLRASPLTETSGRVSKWCGINTDIDDRKRAETLLAGERLLLEMVALGFPLHWVLDAACHLAEEIDSGCQSGVLLIDPISNRFQRGGACCRTSRYVQALEGLYVTDGTGSCAVAALSRSQVIVEDTASDPRWSSHWRDLSLAHGVRACWSTPILSRLDQALGTFITCRAEPGTPTPFQREFIGQLTHIASIAIERAQNDMTLQRREALMAKTQQISASGSFYWNPDSGEITWSEELYRMFQIDSGTRVTLELVAEQHHPDDLPLVQDMIVRAQAGLDFEYEHRLLMPNGSVKYLHTQAYATRDRQGRLEYIGAAHDVTQRHRAEEALAGLRAELAHVSRVNSLGALTASIAHEINQPLAGIIANASTGLLMLGADPPNVEGALETVRRTLRDGHRASDVVTRLRALYSKKVVMSNVVDLNEAATEVVDLLRSEILRHRIALRQEWADGLPRVSGDRVQLQQVVLNLLLNAIEAMHGVEDHSRLLLIRTDRNGSTAVRLSVTDAGSGFDQQHASKLFDAFYTTKREGMGLGLSVSRSIVEGHGGHLWAASNEGRGATFSFSIPCRPDAAAAANHPGAAPPSAVGAVSHAGVP
jgi:PAS domain S-box-containing protein